jgi:hypothetical protein
MLTDTAIVIAGIVIAFTIFALALAWGDYYTPHNERSQH